MGVPKNYNKDFFKTWSSDMAYILGFLYADGNILISKQGGCYVSLYSADKPLLYEIRLALRSEHAISRRMSETGAHYRIQIGSKTLYKDLTNLGMTPTKSRRMLLPKIPKKFFGDFVRGYFDGDGNVWMGNMHKQRARTTPVLFAAFTSGSIAFLRALAQELQERCIRGGNVYVPKGKGWGRLTLSTLDALKLYGIMYNVPHGLYLGRKKSVFDRFMKEREKMRV